MSDSVKKYEEFEERKRRGRSCVCSENINTISVGSNLNFSYKSDDFTQSSGVYDSGLGDPHKLGDEDIKHIPFSETAKKESSNKVDYTELDWDFIDAMAVRMKNESKYPKDNWKKPIDVIELIKPIMRHGRKAIQPIPGDKESLYEHLVALSLNSMMAAYQLKNNNYKLEDLTK